MSYNKMAREHPAARAMNSLAGEPYGMVFVRETGV
jgi:hypothetical protein